MAHTGARAWWADVEHLQDVYERTDEARRRAERADRHGSRERPHADADADAGHPAGGARRGTHPKGTAIPARRTVEIRGRTVPAPSVPRTSEPARRPARRPIERVGARPDRVAMWALLMGILLILVAVGTADASVLAQ